MDNNNTFELPSYFSDLSRVFPVEVLEQFAEIERLTNLINFDDHTDDIDQIMLYPEVGTNVQVAKVTDVYRTTMAELMTRQGIELVDIDDMRTSDILKMFNAVIILAVSPREDALCDVEFDPEMDDYVLATTVLAQLANTCEDEIMLWLDSVSSSTAKYIRGSGVDDDIVEIKPTPSAAIDRVKAYLLKYQDKAPHTLNYIRSTNNVGYDAEENIVVIRDQLTHDLETSMNYDGVAHELRLYILASSQGDNPDDATVDYLIEQITTDPLSIAKIASSLRKITHEETRLS